jgi:hypothetical protein
MRCDSLGDDGKTVFDRAIHKSPCSRRNVMHFRLLWLSALTLLPLFAMPDGAAAQNGAWCARLRGGDSCGFATLEQCRATISGDGGTCFPNPRGPAGVGSGPPAAAGGAAAAAAARRARAEQAERAREAAEERRRARQREKELARQRQRAPAAAKAAPTATAPVAAVSGGGIPVADLDVNAVPALNREGLRRVQIVLKEKGFDPGPLNGVPNPRLQAAVRTFQSRYGIEARGEIDNQTLLALGEASLASQSNR